MDSAIATPPTPARSRLMSRVRSRDTAPEIRVRKALRAWGVGYRLHSSDVTGRPDIVLRGRRQVVFVHGCFWHRHPGCPLASTPKTNTEFWASKFVRNVRRDGDVLEALASEGWGVLVLWQCDIASGKFEQDLRRFLRLS